MRVGELLVGARIGVDAVEGRVGRRGRARCSKIGRFGMRERARLSKGVAPGRWEADRRRVGAAGGTHTLREHTTLARDLNQQCVTHFSSSGQSFFNHGTETGREGEHRRGISSRRGLLGGTLAGIAAQSVPARTAGLVIPIPSSPSCATIARSASCQQGGEEVSSFGPC